MLDSSGVLSFAFNICYVFPEIEKQQIIGSLSQEDRKFVENHVLLKDDIQLIRSKGVETLKKYIDRKNFIIRIIDSII